MSTQLQPPRIRPPVRYLEGLNGLRFVAASVVLLSHAWQSLVKLGVIHAASSTPVFDRGRAAVDFFFTLSGFLITYLLIQESAGTGTVSLKRFYLRRAKRIWPLYYLVLAIGFMILGVAYPLFFHHQYLEFNVAGGLLLFVLFLPNLMTALYHVGMLNPLWSIGVEEQFYLFWAPLVKRFGNRMLSLVLFFVALTVLGYTLMNSGIIRLGPAAKEFFHSLRFHYMAIGSVFAWVLFYRRDTYERSPLATFWFQGATIAVILYHYAFRLPGADRGLTDVLLACLYGTLILNVSVAPKRLINLEWQPLTYLGEISYGIYMYHLTIDYLLRLVVERTQLGAPAFVIGFSYTAVLLGSTVVVAHLSFRHFETYFTGRTTTHPTRPPVADARTLVRLAAP